MLARKNPSRFDGNIRRGYAYRGLWPYRSLYAAAILAAGVLLAGAAWAQVRPIQGGNALDANPMIGSGGNNGARPVTSAINGNLIMSGNVTGGKAFQGFNPISNPSAFQASVGSASLGNFVRDSVGLPGIQSGLSTTSPRPYFDPSQTTVSAGAIQAQTVLPRDLNGTYRLGQGQYQMPAAPLSGTQSTSGYAGQLPYAAPGWTPAGVGMFNPEVVATTPGQVNPNPLESFTITGPVVVSRVGTQAGQDRAAAIANQLGQAGTEQSGQGTGQAGQTAGQTPEPFVSSIENRSMGRQPTAGPLGEQAVGGILNNELEFLSADANAQGAGRVAATRRRSRDGPGWAAAATAVDPPEATAAAGPECYVGRPAAVG